MKIKTSYKLFFLLILFLLPKAVYSQIFYDYESELKRYLSPPIDTTTIKEIASFIGISKVPIPEHSIRIIETHRRFFIEARTFNRNLLKSLSEYKISIMERKDMNSYSVETFTSIVPISDSMKDKMLSVFNKVISYNDDPIKPKVTIKADGAISGVRLYDGPTYKFIVNKNVPSQMDIDYHLDSTDFRSQVIKTNLQIINDLKNSSFDELKYDVYK